MDSSTSPRPRSPGCSSAKVRPSPHRMACTGFARSPALVGWALRVRKNSLVPSGCSAVGWRFAVLVEHGIGRGDVEGETGGGRVENVVRALQWFAAEFGREIVITDDPPPPGVSRRPPGAAGAARWVRTASPPGTGLLRAVRRGARRGRASELQPVPAVLPRRRRQAGCGSGGWAPIGGRAVNVELSAVWNATVSWLSRSRVPMLWWWLLPAPISQRVGDRLGEHRVGLISMKVQGLHRRLRSRPGTGPGCADWRPSDRRRIGVRPRHSRPSR